MNILIKLMSIVALVIAPTLATLHQDDIQKRRDEKLNTLMIMKGGNTQNVITPVIEE